MADRTVIMGIQDVGLLSDWNVRGCGNGVFYIGETTANL